MSSILTNNGATTALATLKSINASIEGTQYQISTGKKVHSSADNAAAWAISKAMEADVAGFEKISESLSLGQSTVSVARMGAETVTELLTEVKGKVVAAQEENVDRDKIQADIDSLREQIGSIVAAASFNGANLLQNTGTTDGSGTVNVLASLDRSTTGVAASDISVKKQDLGTQTQAAGTVSANAGVAGTINDGASGNAILFANDDDGTIAAGNTYQVGSGGVLGLSADVDYVARDGDDLNDVTKEMVSRLNEQAQADGVNLTFSTTSTAGQIAMTNNTGGNLTLVAGTAQQADTDGSENDGTVGGGLEDLASIDVTTDAGVDQALTDIEGLIQTSIDAAASFGSAQGRLETQSDFVDKLSGSLKSGIGSLVDTDMEEASAKLKALQVQQQLAVQSLSMANSAPQQLLSLFR
jgi:flagellin